MVATVTALLPAGIFYAEYAMTDAIYPVLVLAWLLATHSWLTARSARGRYAAAVGSALLAGYAYAVHSRGAVIVAAYVAVAVLIAWRRLASRGTVAAALGLAAAGGASQALDRYLSAAMDPEGTRDLTARMEITLHSVPGVISVFEMAAGQIWRLMLDSWGLAGIGLVAAAAAVICRGIRADLRIMAALAVAVTVLTACTVPAALPRVSGLLRAAGTVALAVVSLVAVTQMTSHISQAAAAAQAPDTTGFVTASALKPGDQIAVAYTVGSKPGPSDVGCALWAPQAFEVWWTELEFFDSTQARARGRERGRGGLADRPARAGELAAGPFRVADRRLQPGRRLGHLAERRQPTCCRARASRP